MEKAKSTSIYIGLGANLPHPQYGVPRQTLEAALAELARRGVQTLNTSPWYRSAPVPASDQPWYVNAVAEIDTAWSADRLLAELHAVEEAFGRVRSVPNAARFIDLDLIDFKGEISSGGPGHATLPHPRMQDRLFVLRPLADLDRDWRHPRSGTAIAELIARLGPDQRVERVQAP